MWRTPTGRGAASADYTYGYGPALADGVVRPVIFLAYSGEMRWRTRAGDELAATLGTPLTKDQLSQAWRAALDPKGDWIRQVMAGGRPAADRGAAAASRTRGAWSSPPTTRRPAPTPAHLRNDHRSQGATVVLSDDPGAAGRSSSSPRPVDRWLVAVRMVSEGRRHPPAVRGRLRHRPPRRRCSSPRRSGRFVRARRRGEIASVFLPSVPILLGLRQRDGGGARPRARTAVRGGRRARHDRAARTRPTGSEDTPDAGDELPFETHGVVSRRSTGCSSTAASSAPAANARRRRISSACPGCWSPTRWRRCCASASRASRRGPQGVETAAAGAGPTRGLAELRRELNGLVGAWNHRTGQPHATIHTTLRRVCGGPPVAQATAEQLRQRIAKLRAWAVGAE